MNLHIDGLRVDEVAMTHSMTLILTNRAQLSIESPFELAEPESDPVVLDPETLGPDRESVQALRGQVVASARADRETGALLVQFAGGTTLQVQGDPDFEAWSVTSADGSRVISLPGGGLSSWGVDE